MLDEIDADKNQIEMNDQKQLQKLSSKILKQRCSELLFDLSTPYFRQIFQQNAIPVDIQYESYSSLFDKLKKMFGKFENLPEGQKYFLTINNIYELSFHEKWQINFLIFHLVLNPIEVQIRNVQDKIQKLSKEVKKIKNESNQKML